MNALFQTSKTEPPPLLSPSRWTPPFRARLHDYLSARRRFLGQHAVRCVVVLLTALALAFILADVVFGLPAWARWLALGTVVLSSASLLVRSWWVPARALDEAGAARELERGFPELGQRLRTAHELESAPADTQGIAPELASALTRDAQQRLTALHPETLLPTRRLRLLTRAAIGTAGVFALLFVGWGEFRSGTARLLAPSAPISFTRIAFEAAPAQFTDRENPIIAARISGRRVETATLFLREAGGAWMPMKMTAAGDGRRFDAVLAGRVQSCDYYVAAGDGRTAERHLRCIVTPKIEKVFAELQFPDYTGLPPQRLESGDVRAVEGTHARITFQLDHPLTAASARAGDGRKLPLSLLKNQLVIQTTLTRGESVYQLAGQDADGIELPAATYKLVGLEDKLPEVQLVEPTRDLEATPVWEILARLKAKDDFGLAEVGLILVVNGETHLLAHRTIAEKAVHEAGEMATASLEDFTLALTDNLQIFAYARDHKPRENARAVSNLRVVDIRQFKTRWRAGQALPAGSLPMNGAQFKDLLALIRDQRKVVSDVFVLKENGAPAENDLGASCAEIGARETKTAEATRALKTRVEALGGMDRDGLVLLDTAAQQMDETAEHLRGRLLVPAHQQADGALTSLLSLRRLVEKILLKKKQPLPSEATDEGGGKPPAELAAIAERLAKEEREVRGKVTPPADAAKELAVTRHQQEVAVTDAGELYAGIVASPEQTPLMISRMDEAEKAMQHAEETLRNGSPPTASPHLQTAEEKLLALAAQLRALDEKNADEAVGQLAEMATQAQQRLEQEQKERAEQNAEDPSTASTEDHDAGKSDQPPTAADASPGDQGSTSPAPGNASPEVGSGEGHGKAPPGRGREKPSAGEVTKSADRNATERESLDAVAEKSATIDDVLKSMVAREKGPESERLAELRQSAKTAELSPQVRQLAAAENHAQAGADAGELAKRFGDVAKGLSQAQRRLQQSRVERLTEALAQTKALAQTSGKPGGKPAGQNNGKTGEGTKGEEPGNRSSPRPGKRDPNESRDAKTGGRGGGDTQTAYLNALQRTGDDELQKLAQGMADEAKAHAAFHTSDLRAVEKRLSKIIEDLLGTDMANRRSDHVPGEYDHLVESYYRALSEDFGNELPDPESQKAKPE